MQIFDPIWWRGLHRLAATEFHPESGGKVLILHKKGSNLRIESYTDFEEDAQVRDFLKENKVPVLLCLNAAKVRSAILAEEQQENICSSVLGVQVGNEVDFVLQQSPASNGRLAVSLVRRDQAEEAVERLGVCPLLGIQISPFALGVLAAQFYEDFFSENYQIHKGEASLYFQNGQPARRQDLEGEAFQSCSDLELAQKAGIKPEFLAVYASAVALLLQSPQGLADHAPSQQRGQNYREGHFLRKLIASLTGILLVLALGLALSRSLADQRLQDLQAQHEQNQPLLLVLDKLRARSASLGELRNDLRASSLRPSRVSWFTDQIATAVPAGLRLHALTLYPEVEDYKKARLRIKSGWDALVQGYSQNSAAVARFSQNLSQLSGIREVEVHHSEMNFREDRYEFLLLLKLQGHADQP